MNDVCMQKIKIGHRANFRANFPQILSILQTVAMATNNRKDNHFFAIFHLFSSFSRDSLGKIS